MLGASYDVDVRYSRLQRTHHIDIYKTDVVWCIVCFILSHTQYTRNHIK